MNLNGAGLLPGNATAYEQAQAEVSARLLAADTDAIRRERDPLRCDSAFVPYLGWERSVHRWTGVEATDRASTASSFADHLSYGAPAALEKEISLDVGWSVAIEEFWQYSSGVWPYFRVVVPVADGSGAPPPASAVWASAIQRKNVRDMPDRMIYLAGESGPLNIGAAVHVAGRVNVMPLDPTPRFPGPLAYGVAVRVIGEINVLPF